MDLPRPALLKQYTFHVSSEGRAFAYFIADSGSGKVLSVSRSMLAAVRRVAAVVGGDRRARDTVGENDARETMTAINYLKTASDQDVLKKKRFNPVIMQLSLFDVGPLQPYLAGLARSIVGWPVIIALAALALTVFLLGAATDWAIGAEFTGILSIEALLTFGLIAPFLKLIHETGHVLAATAYGVRIRKAGVNFIGLYPLPFVDASEADLTASRRQRIAISLAGIFTDLFVGLTAAVIWHFVESDAVRAIAGRVVVFSTLNSLLFNANPLMKMDGYYALADAIGQRGLSQRAARSFVEFRRVLLSLGAEGALPKTRGRAALMLFGLASFLYRFAIVYSLFTRLMPLYLGLGIAISAWGAYVMFLSPMLADRAPVPQGLAKPVSPIRKWGGRLVVFGALAALMFVPLPYVQRIDMRPDITGSYSITTNKAGFIAEMDARALALENAALQGEIALMELALADAELSASLVQGIDPAQARVAADNIAATEAQLAILRAEAASLDRRIADEGVLIWNPRLRPGTYLADGSPVAVLYPAAGAVVLTGQFPERYVDKFDTALDGIEIRFGDTFVTIPAADAALVEEVNLDQSTGIRSFTLRLTAPQAPAALVGVDVKARVLFRSEPIWRHILFWGEGRIAAFRNAQIADREQRIGG